MKAIILAGGYAKRLWPLTKNTPKPLLKVGDMHIIEYIIKKIEPIKDIDVLVISTNKKFEKKFREWVNQHWFKEKIRLVIEPSSSERKKLGAVGGINYVIHHTKLDEDFLVIAGDNIFEFDLQKFIDFFNEKYSPCIALHNIRSRRKVKERYGVCVVDKNKRIINFQEKPKKPLSTLVSTGIYAFPKRKVKWVSKYIQDGCNPDAMGFFITWLYPKRNIYGWVFKERWFDIGSKESLKEANKYYRSKK